MLNEFTEWLYELLKELAEILLYIPLKIVQTLLDGIVYMLDLIPVPEFVSTTNISDVLTPEVAWMLAESGFGEGLAIIGAGVAFRTARRIFTLGIW